MGSGMCMPDPAQFILAGAGREWAVMAGGRREEYSRGIGIYEAQGMRVICTTAVTTTSYCRLTTTYYLALVIDVYRLGPLLTK